ncbi:MAG: hypothetical protein KJZ75_11370 [Hyphomonadaceae bacterium]|nr:hypothetical protein [Hyphomonadaceae bacterium]
MTGAEIIARIEQAERWRELAPLIPAFVAFICFAATFAALSIFFRERGERSRLK